VTKISELVNLILAIVLIIGLGFLAKRLKLLEEDDAQKINQVIFYFTLPAFVFLAILEARLDASLIIIPFFALGIGLVCATLAFLAGKKWLAPATLGAFIIASSIGNTGYLGFPITREIFGQANVVKAVFYDHFGTVVFLFTFGFLIAEAYGKSKEKVNRLGELLTFPPLWAMAAAFLLRSVALPEFLLAGLRYLSEATIALIMFSLGLTLEPGKAAKYKLALFLLVLIKLILGPVLVLSSSRFVSLSPVVFGVIALEAGMPTALISLVFGLRYKLDMDFLPAAIMVTTLVSMITIPLWQLLLS
jgi:predicted permease